MKYQAQILPAPISQITGLQAALDAKAPDADLTALEDDVSALDAATTSALALKAPLASPTFTGTVVLPATVTVPDGTFAIADVNGLQTALDAKAPTANPTFTGTVTIPDNALAIADVNGLQSALDGKQASDTQLTSLAGLSYTGNSLKGIRVNAGEDGFELATAAGSGDLVSTNNLSDVANAATAFTNIKQAASDTATGVIEIAIQSEMETGTDTTRAVTPGRQHFHPSAAKCWVCSTQSTTTIQQSYNIASVEDTAAGRSTVVIATDFSGTTYTVIPNAEHNSASGTTQTYQVDAGSRAAGSYIIESWQVDGTEVLTDPSAAWFSVAFGDQA